jgi:drug/metabolite transporter (DMT)-like permease
MVAIAFIGMSLAWSVSWFAMKLQADSFLPPELSVFYRFFFATILMFILCFFSKQRMLLKRNEVPYLIIIGLCNFCLNFTIGYFAVKYIASGVMAVIFSLTIIISEIFSAYFDKRKIAKKVIISSLVGFFGLVLFILPIVKFSNDSKAIIGFLMTLSVTFIFSFGSAVVSRNKKINQTPLYTSIAYGCAISSIFLFLFNVARGNEFGFDFSLSYITSLAYLVLVATVLAFICLFYLIQNIGSTRANYTALVYPAIALIISSFFEDLSFNFLSFVGFGMIILALIIEFLPNRAR